MKNDLPDDLEITVPTALAGKRVDQVVAACMPDYSRSRLQQWLKSGFIQIDARTPKLKEKMYGGELIVVKLQAALADQVQESWEAQPIALDVVYEDDSLIIINKPAGLVVHPGAGNKDGTLVNALLHHAPELSKLPRAGIIHRIDKETTGLLVIARNLTAHHNLSAQLQAREFHREYQAIVGGVMTGGRTIDEPIGRHPTQRIKMAVLPDSDSAKEAITHYRVEKKFRAHTLINVKLETGRTHQIRVHMAYIKHPILGDQVYAGRLRIPPKASETFLAGIRAFKRQALHAKTLGFLHPETDEYIEWSADLPEDMSNIIKLLEDDLASV